MALYKIGITEAGDAGVDLSWEEKLDDVDAAVLITKCVSPDFFDAALKHKDKLVIHTTITGIWALYFGAKCTNSIRGVCRNYGVG